MKTLFEAMRDFNARNASENAIQKMFAEIAVSALLGGYFLANNTKVYQWISLRRTERRCAVGRYYL